MIDPRQPQHLGIVRTAFGGQRLHRLVEIEQDHGVKFSFRADPNFHLENFKIVNAATGEELN